MSVEEFPFVDVGVLFGVGDEFSIGDGDCEDNIHLVSGGVPPMGMAAGADATEYRCRSPDFTGLLAHAIQVLSAPQKQFISYHRR